MGFLPAHSFMSSEQKETVGQYTTLKPSVASVQPIRIVTPSDQEGSKEIASAMADRHAGDPTAYQGDPTDSESKEKDGAESEKGGFRNNLMSGLVVSGIVVAVLGALVAVARNMKMRT